MFRQRFRLTTPTLVVVIENGKEALRYIPAGAEIVVNDSLDGAEPNRLIRVEWEGGIAKMFAVDVLERGERIGGATV